MESQHSKILLFVLIGLILICLINCQGGQTTQPPTGQPGQSFSAADLSALGQIRLMLSQVLSPTSQISQGNSQLSGPGSNNSVNFVPTFQLPAYLLNTMIQYLNYSNNCSFLAVGLSRFQNLSASYNTQTGSGQTPASGGSNTANITITMNTTQLVALVQCLSGLGGGNSPSNGGGLPMGPPQGPPRPPSAPVNAFANVDPRIAFFLSDFLPTLDSITVAAMATNRSLWAPIFDSLQPSDILSGCGSGSIKQLYQYMEEQIVRFNDSNSFVTYQRLDSVIQCKMDRNFKRLLSVPSNFSANLTAFYGNVVNYLPSKAAGQCMNQNPTMANSMTNLSPTQLAANPAYISFLKPARLEQMSASDSMTVAAALSNSGSTISRSMAKSLGSNIAEGTPLDNIAAIASAVPLSCFSSTSPAQLANLVGTMDLENMTPLKKGFIASKVAASGNASLIATLLSSTTDSSIVNAIPAAKFASLGINPFSLPATSLPLSYQKSLADSYLANGSLSTITNSSVLARVLAGIDPGDINSLTGSSSRRKKRQSPSMSTVPTTLTNIANASASNGISFTSIQRDTMLSNLLNSLSSIANTTNASVYLYQLSTSQLSVLYPLFVGANDTVLTAFSSISKFANVIASVADLDITQCCAYPRNDRALFASYAAKYSFSYYNLALSDLYTLGPCLASVLPDIYLQNIDPSTFVTYFSTLGNVYQPSASQQAIAQSLVASYAANASIMASTSQETLLFTTLGSLAIFYPFSTYANNISSWSSNGGSAMSTMTAAYDPTVSDNQLCQAGLNGPDTSGFTNLVSSFGAILLTQHTSSVQSAATTAASGRKKRQSSSYSYTCSDLTALGLGMTALTTTQLATISTTEFYSCQSLIGSQGSWSSSQLSVLASTALSYYGSAYSISDSNIAILDNLMLGFSSTSLSSLVFTTTTSIGALGQLSGWSSAQLAALTTPLITYISTYLSGTVTSDFVTSAGNLLCAFSSTQVSSVSPTVFAASISSLSSINLACPNIASWYALAKTVSAYGSSLYTSSSSISELGSVMSGITTTDLASVSADAIHSFSTLSFKFMPAATVNSMSATQLAGLSHVQVVALLNSPYYSSFSTAVTNALASATGGTTTSGATQITLTYFAKFLMGFYFILLSIFYCG